MANVKGGDKALRAIAELAQRLGGEKALKVGFLSGATYPDGTPVALVAAWNNYGTNTIPARPFFSNMVAKESPAWPKEFSGVLKATNYDVDKTLHLMGHRIKGQLQQSIRDTNSPPLAEATLRARGVNPKMKYKRSDPKTYGAKPLVHTKVLINSVDYTVDKK
jgi:hypothetical protein